MSQLPGMFRPGVPGQECYDIDKLLSAFPRGTEDTGGTLARGRGYIGFTLKQTWHLSIALFSLKAPLSSIEIEDKFSVILQ